MKDPKYPLHYLLPPLKKCPIVKFFCGLHIHISFHLAKLLVMDEILCRTAFPRSFIVLNEWQFHWCLLMSNWLSVIDCCIYYLRLRLARRPSVTLSRCVCVRRIILGGEGNALYPVLSDCVCCIMYHFILINTLCNLILNACLSTMLEGFEVYTGWAKKNGATLFCRNTAQICTIFFAQIKVV